MRCRFESLSRTGWRSTDSWTSKPRWRAPSSNAERSADSVFSGYSATLPRRAISSGSRLDGICSAAFYRRRARMRRRHQTLGGVNTICYCMSCGESMYEASFAGRLNIAARCAALLLALGCLQACSSGEGTRPIDPPVQPPPPPPPAAATARRDLRSRCPAVQRHVPRGRSAGHRHQLRRAARLPEPAQLHAADRAAAGAGK